MSTIRRQSIISSLVIYVGFAVGLLNTYFFIKYFTPAQYGLTSVFVNIATTMMAFASLAMPAYIAKFFPYYKDHVAAEKSDLMTVSLLVGCFGFLLVIIAGWVFRDFVIRKFGENSPELIIYYRWIFPMGFGYTIYMILEAFTWNIGKPVLTNFLKEVQWRVLTTVIIVLFILQVIKDYDLFIKLYAFTYPAIAVTLFAYLIIKRKLHFNFSFSKVTRRYFKKIVTLCVFVYSSSLVFTISQVFDSLVIAAALQDGLKKAGIFGLAYTLISVIGAPQRGVVSASIPHLARAWKDKNRPLLERIYRRSSINMLLFACGMYLLIVLNYNEAIYSFDLNQDYLLGFHAFLFLGASRIVDLGTGVNTEIIGTSNYWRFQLISGIILLVCMLPLTYILARKYDLVGPAIANFISITLYNILRVVFLWKRFRLFPFTKNSIYTLLLAAASFIVAYFAGMNISGFGGLVVRSAVFVILYGGSALYFRVSPDLLPVMQTLKKKLGIRKF